MEAYSIPQRCELRAGDTLDGYRVEKLLGEGTFGLVYRVTREASGECYALKLLKLWQVVYDEERNSLLKRFKMEYDTGQISSRHLVRSLDYGSLQGNPYIVMIYCPGGDLTAWIGKPIFAKEADRIARDILEGLADLHANGKVHRDIKPENVLFDNNNCALLTDFGISGDKNIRLTRRDIFGKSASLFGTYAYMPPEQLDRLREATVLPTTDFFSFGVMMFELFTGELPFGPLTNDAQLTDYIKRVKHGNWNRDLAAARGVSAQWQHIIDGCLVPDYRHRFPNAASILQLLDNGSGGAYAFSGASRDIPFDFGQDSLMLRIMQGEEYGRCYSLNDYVPRERDCGIITLGRRDTGVHNDIALLETAGWHLSRHHATIEKSGYLQQWFLRDGQWTALSGSSACDGWRRSTNGTYLNSAQVTENGAPLKPGDIITMGDTTLRVEICAPHT